MNLKLFKRLRNRFARMKHPQHFRMAQIAIKTDCGAAMCFIGHTLDLAGYRMRLKRNYDPEDDEGLLGADDAARHDYDFIDPETGISVYDPAVEAARLLEISLEDSDRLLFGRYELKTPKQAVKYLDKLIAEAK